MSDGCLGTAKALQAAASVQEVVCVDRGPQRVQQLAAQGLRATDAMDAMLADDTIPVVFIAAGNQNEDIVRRVLAGEPPMTSARDAFETMRLVFAADRSADAGQVVRLVDLDEGE